MAKSNTIAEFDVKGNGEANASPDLLKRLRDNIARGSKLITAIENAEADLARLKQELHKVRTNLLPDIMAEIQSEDFSHKGWRVRIKDFISGSLPKDEAKRKKAIEWLEKNDGSSLIKTSVEVEFPRSQRKEAIQIADMIKKKGLAPKVDTSVNANTLKAFARERMENGDKIDFATLGLYSGKLAEFEKLEEKKKGGKAE